MLYNVIEEMETTLLVIEDNCKRLYTSYTKLQSIKIHLFHVVIRQKRHSSITWLKSDFIVLQGVCKECFLC